MRKGLNTVCFVQVNYLLLSKSYEKISADTSSRSIDFWSGRIDFELGRDDRNSVTLLTIYNRIGSE